ncbi:MAG: HAMP domain-containing histidine kinase [Clostridia bacterium]|nr:HAMP domain-containing histidine kinase [Clostridia bacterium]
MERLIWIAALLGLAALIFAALYFVQKKRIERLTERIEDFLVTGKNPLEYSVREDSIAPIHNAAAELENRILLSREQVRDELRRTSTLTADISHQLKTPLASLKLFCELDEGAHMEAQLGQIERMEKLIYSLLRLERLCADGYDFVFEDHEVGQIIREAWESVCPVWPGRTLKIDGSAHIRCDAKWMGEAFLNLLKNACEHTDKGGKIHIRLEMTETTFYATVEDNGGGVPQKDLPHLFERFYRAGDKKENGGAGIGLSIVQEIVRRHHGDIRAENTGKGLKFTISMPVMNLVRT